MLTSVRDLAENVVLAALLALAVWAVFHFQRDRRAKRGVRIRVAMASILLGTALCFVPHEPRPSERQVGFPLPVVVFSLEQGSRIDYVPTGGRLLLLACLNISLVAGAVHAAASVVLKWRGL